MHSVDNCINRTIAPDQKHNLDQPNHWFGPLSPLWNRSSHRIPCSNLPIIPELAYYENTIHLRCIKSGCSHYAILILPEETFLYCWHEINSNSTITLLLLPLHWGLKMPDFSTITFTYKTNSSSYTQSGILNNKHTHIQREALEYLLDQMATTPQQWSSSVSLSFCALSAGRLEITQLASQLKSRVCNVRFQAFISISFSFLERSCT